MGTPCSPFFSILLFVHDRPCFGRVKSGHVPGGLHTRRTGVSRPAQTSKRGRTGGVDVSWTPCPSPSVLQVDPRVGIEKGGRAPNGKTYLPRSPQVVVFLEGDPEPRQGTLFYHEVPVPRPMSRLVYLDCCEVGGLLSSPFVQSPPLHPSLGVGVGEGMGRLKWVRKDSGSYLPIGGCRVG